MMQDVWRRADVREKKLCADSTLLKDAYAKRGVSQMRDRKEKRC